MNEPRVASIHAGKVAPLGPDGVPSGFVKHGVFSAVNVAPLGIARMQVCQPRQPCFKFALRFGDVLMPGAMRRNGRSGWYYRILTPGVISPGDRVEVLERPNPDFAFTRLVELITHHNATRAEWQQMKDMRGLALDWRRRAAEVLARQPKLHDFQPRG